MSASIVRLLRIILGALAGAIIAYAAGIFFWLGQTLSLRSPTTVFAVFGAVAGAAVSWRAGNHAVAREGTRAMTKVALLLLACGAVIVGTVVVFVAAMIWQDFVHGRLHF